MAKTSFIHPTASIHPSATIGEQCWIGPHVSIEANVQIGDRVRIEAFSHIYHACQIDADCYIGTRCQIGSDGFGYAQDAIGCSHWIPQIGIVHLEVGVRVLAHSAIDRAAFTKTRIGAGSLIGGHSHIAHNLEIGEASCIHPGFVVAGSAKFGARVVLGARCNSVGHIEVCDDFQCAPMSLINNDVTQAGKYAGHPLSPTSIWKEIHQCLQQYHLWPWPNGRCE